MSDDITFGTTVPVVNLHTIYMPIQVSHEEDIDRICQSLRSYAETDHVVMYLANYGGSCHAGQRLINAMADCRAPITVIVDAPCYSMGALLALAGSSLIMHQSTFLMFHNYSSRTGGKGGELLEGIKNTDGWLKDQQYSTCYPFLTKAEISKITKDQDIYIAHDDPSLQLRLERHFKYQAKQRKRIHLGVN